MRPTREQPLAGPRYNKGLKAGLAAVAKGVRAISKERRINTKDPKDVAAKFK